MTALSALLDEATFDFEDVPICLDAKLSRRRDAAMSALADARRRSVDAKRRETADERLSVKGDVTLEDEVARHLAEVEAIEDQMRAKTIRLRITGVPFDSYNETLAAHPPRKGKQETFNSQTFFLALARLTVALVDANDPDTVHPISDSDWAKLTRRLTDGEHDRIADATMSVNRSAGRTGVDFLFGNSEKTPASSETSE